MTILIHTVGGFTYAADKEDIVKLMEPKFKGDYWTFEQVLLYWTSIRIGKGLLFLPGSKEGIGVKDAAIRVRDVVSIEETDAVEVGA